MLIRWTTAAADDLERHIHRIRQDNPTAAREVARVILKSVERLTALPNSGRPGHRPNTRELVIPRYPAYTVVYRVGPSAVRLLRV